MAWFGQSQEIKENILHVEERLAIIAKSQDDLNRHTQEIKDLTSSIVKTLDSNVSADLLVKLAPVLETIPPLLQEVTPTLKSIEAQFATLYQSQLKIQTDVSHVMSMITDLTTQLRDIS